MIINRTMKPAINERAVFFMVVPLSRGLLICLNDYPHAKQNVQPYPWIAFRAPGSG